VNHTLLRPGVVLATGILARCSVSASIAAAEEGLAPFKILSM
jgi:hypothetical protein